MPFPAGRVRAIGLFAQNENAALAHTTLIMARRLAKFGFEAEALDLLNPEGMGRLSLLLKSGELAFAFAFAGVGSQLQTKGGENIWSSHKVPFASLWYDHPSYNYRQHDVASPYVLNVYHMRDHYEVKQRYFSKSSPSIILPFMQEPHRWADEKPWRKRRNAILYAKTAYDPQTFLSRWDQYPPVLRAILHEMSDVAVTDRNCDLTSLAEKAFAAHGIVSGGMDDLMGVVQETDRYVRAWRSDRLARALLPFPAHIIGRGWDYLPKEGAQATFGEAVDFTKYHDHMFLEYKIHANSNPLWRDGLHERVTMALNCGGIALTDHTERSDAVYGGLDSYVAFEWSDPLEDAVSMALQRAEDPTGFAVQNRARIAERLSCNETAYWTPLLKALADLPA